MKRHANASTMTSAILPANDDPKLSEENSEDEQTFSAKVDQGKKSPENCKETGAENEPAIKTNRGRAYARKEDNRKN